jgi:tRNA-specific 2-thiouridylase
VRCNADLKFATLVERAAGFDAVAVATGHYARVDFDEDRRRFRLRRGVDAGKDQSYFLFSLTQDQLARAAFPIGALTKADVRARAHRLGLDVAVKPDSHEICFVPDGDAGGFIDRHLDEEDRSGEIVDSAGRVLGRHRGVHRLTVGQRKGLGLAEGVPLYVLRLDADARQVVVGPREELGGRSLEASQVNWIDGAAPSSPRRLTARIRHRHQDAPALVTPIGSTRASVEFDAPQIAIAPGQAVVFYDGEEVVGGGWISGNK